MKTSSAVGRIAKENLILNILVIVAIIAAIAYLLHASEENQPKPMTLAINELMVSNKTQLPDEDGDFSDWIEIYNYGDEPISLKGFGLSDNENDPFAWVFPDVTINPKEFLIVWASGKDRPDPLGELHTNFKISKYGETIILTHENGTTIDKVTFGSIEEDFTIGRKPDGVGEWVIYEDITPGNANSVIVYEMPNSPPEVSHQRGFYTQPFLLELKTDVSDAVIRYTLNGSEPTKDSPVYTEPIEIKDRTDEPSKYANIQSTSFDWKPPKGKIFKATVVRARLFKGDVPISDVVTHTYFVSPDMPKEVHGTGPIPGNGS